jgi:hypothetical protein
MAGAGWEGASTDGNADASGGSAMVKVCTNMVDMSAILAGVSVPADGAWLGVLLKAGPSTAEAVNRSIGECRTVCRCEHIVHFCLKGISNITTERHVGGLHERGPWQPIWIWVLTPV